MGVVPHLRERLPRRAGTSELAVSSHTDAFRGLKHEEGRQGSTYVGLCAARVGQDALELVERVSGLVAGLDARRGEPLVRRVLYLSAHHVLDELDDGRLGCVGEERAVTVGRAVRAGVVVGEAGLGSD